MGLVAWLTSITAGWQKFKKHINTPSEIIDLLFGNDCETVSS
jgi:hypothetical protein